MNARTYDPITGVFMQRDPLEDQFPGWTPYHYVHNNPLNLVDPTGMRSTRYASGDSDSRNARNNQPQKKDSGCPPCGFQYSLRSALNPIANKVNKTADNLNEKTEPAREGIIEATNEATDKVAEVTETVVKEGQGMLNDVSAASSVLAIGSASVSIATGIGPDDAILGPATALLTTFATATDATATVFSVVDALMFGGDQQKASNNVKRTVFSVSVAGSAGGVVSNVLKPENQKAAKSMVKNIINIINQ